ncbi:hypothetical protein CU098_004534, partial [Rhizopus stolonifer]
MLNAIFSDTLLRWRGGERTTEATKRPKKTNESVISCTVSSIKNLMDRHSDLVAYNEKRIPLCLCK